jgi:acyl-CoA synthetase (AMP-forming)/AMP-acid ligase II
MLDSNMTMAQAFSQVAESRRKQIALTSGDMHYTYGQLLDRTRRLAVALQSIGFDKGERVVAFLPPGADFVCLFFALAEIGGVFVPLNPQLRPYSYNQVLQDADPVMVVTDQPHEEGAFPQLANLKHIILNAGEGGSTPTLDEMVARVPAEASPISEVSPEDLLALLYTSGTTGVPKGTMHTHRSLITPVLASLKIRELWLKRLDLKSIGQTAKALARYKTRLLRVAGRPQIFLSTVGWHSITGIELMLQALLMGDHIVVMPRFHPRLAMELVQREKITILVAIPTAFQAMLSLEDFDSYDTSTLLICGTGAMPCPPELGRKIQEHYKCALHIGFGSTETAGGIAIPNISDSNELQATTVGKPLPGMQVKIVDDDGHESPTGKVGELLCRGDSIMQGYYRAPDATSDVIDKDGWYSTGDLARMDDEGYLQIVGRKRDMIIRGGQNIYPAEIEAYLVNHPDIQEAAVVGVPSEMGGEQAWAFIILKPGAELSTRQVLDYCRKELEPYQIPNRVRFVTDFPRTELGKPQKFRLQSDILDELRKEK